MKRTLEVAAVALVAAALFLASMAGLAMWSQGGGGVTPAAHEAAAIDAATVSSERSGPGDVPVLCYHYLRGSAGPLRFVKVLLYVVLSLPVLDDNEVWTLTQDAFERQMEYLHDNGYETITLDELARWQEGQAELPPRPVVVTFDDGDRSVYDYAWPILEKYGFEATYFVITGRVGERWSGLDFLSWDELRELEESGTFSIESHSHDLHYKTGDKYNAQPVVLAASEGSHVFEGYERWEDKVLDDLRHSRDVIERRVGRRPRYLAWPYGHGDERTEHVAAEAGFERTCWLREGQNGHFAGDALAPAERPPVYRYAVSARTSMRTFKRMLAGKRTRRASSQSYTP
jgi:peptidoglycan/xylan/chitin deacetylase (PgdA/CDA1 family)